MRLVKRVLIFAGEMAIWMIGSLASLVLGAMVEMEFRLYPAFAAVFLAGLLLTGFGFLAFRRRTRNWRRRFVADAWMRSQAERRTHPDRARIKRIAIRISVWIPSAVAALVLFFFPVVSHIVHPRAGNLGSYRIPIPWTAMVFPSAYPPGSYESVYVVLSKGARGRFGVMPLVVFPFWTDSSSLSLATFWFGPRDGWTADDGGHFNEIRRDFPVVSDNVTCWELRYIAARGERRAGVNCGAVISGGHLGFGADFYGQEADLPAFYHMVQSVRRAAR